MSSNCRQYRKSNEEKNISWGYFISKSNLKYNVQKAINKYNSVKSKYKLNRQSKKISKEYNKLKKSDD